MIATLTGAVYAVCLTTGLVLGDAPQQVAAVLLAVALVSHALLRRARTHHPAVASVRASGTEGAGS